MPRFANPPVRNHPDAVDGARQLVGGAGAAAACAGELAGTAFAHPVERAFAELLDEHGVRWLYEPVTFVLERNPDGSVHEAVTPDFYLPGLGMFIETTVMSQRLTNRKNRKIRKLRERFGIEVHVLYRRDILGLARRWNLGPLERAALAGPRA